MELITAGYALQCGIVEWWKNGILGIKAEQGFL
jgi:hypothetical protein